VRHETGVSVLAAPGDPAEADRITPPDVKRILEAARAQFDYVIVDTPSRLSEIVLAAFDQSETLFGMLTLDLPSVRNMSVFLNTLDRLRIPADDVCLVLNKEESDVGIDVAQIEKLFPQRFNSTLPYAREVSRSINLGMPVLASSPQSPVSRRMSMGMAQVLPEPDRQRLLAAAPAAPGNGRSWLRRLLGSRRS
jgi:pilus assembly protein CpaE